MVADTADDHFYKYTSASTGRIVLETAKLRWSSPFLFNDPFDNRIDLGIEGDPTFVVARALDKLWSNYNGDEPPHPANRAGLLFQSYGKADKRMSRQQFDSTFGPGIEGSIARGDKRLRELNEKLRLIARQHKMLCLTKAASSVPMWAYYADNHRGMVLRFRTVPELDSPWPAGAAVIYSQSTPSLMNAEEFSDVLSGRSQINHTRALHRRVYTKSIEWSHEREWRVFSGLGRDPDAEFEDLRFDEQELGGVILGCNMPTESRTAIADLVRRKYPHADLLLAVPSLHEFRLEFAAFEPKRDSIP